MCFLGKVRKANFRAPHRLDEPTRLSLSTVASLQSLLPFHLARSVLTAQIQNSLMRDRLMAALAGAFGLLAGVLAVLGLYGVIAYMVARRRNEIGVRIALGATRTRVV